MRFSEIERSTEIWFFRAIGNKGSLVKLLCDLPAAIPSRIADRILMIDGQAKNAKFSDLISRSEGQGFTFSILYSAGARVLTVALPTRQETWRLLSW